MAQTLSNGFVVPQRTDPISESGVDEMRLLGASGDARVGQLDLQSRARDDDLADQIAGMDGMTYVGAWESGREYRINDVVTHGGDSWARLTAGSTGEPGADSTAWGLVARKGDGGGFGELTETSVPGLWEGADVGVEARLAALEYESGERDLTALLDGVTSGQLLVERAGHSVQMTFNDLEVEDQGSSYTAWGGLLPTGWRPASAVGYRYFPLSPTSSTHSAGPMRVSKYGGIVVYDSDGGRTIRGTVTWTTTDPVPTTPLGDSA